MNITKHGWVYDIEVTKYQKFIEMRDEPIDGELEFNVISVTAIVPKDANIDDILSEDDLAAEIWEKYDEYMFFADCMGL